ncbi:conserved hypothetical protein [Neospora caninum Liverpool]|uniref:Uncharacterized protein n=1 Tax=Neospora caninum (strain Liverpool) TaxID=572307 RepID=F0VPD3_NEOCL|nr:conserved hypothetical protein [Neospora caninum Liverpool]CBZ55579.1 conserved hypothetical protein [Neospora caninum Liverpool]CEL70321.1 TPA: hypothetical protein BN1204_060030 [Neospora caninum Liverpool]|eukprot:XP_003885607.1 conserved hypothetical protein [Neospora caninum Liverpool]
MTAQRDSGSTAPSAAKETETSQQCSEALPVFCLLDGNSESGPYLPLGPTSGDGSLNGAFFYDAKAHVLKEIGVDEDIVHVAPLPAIRGAGSKGGSDTQLCLAVTSAATRASKPKDEHPSELQAELRCHLVSCSPLGVLSSCTVGQCSLRAQPQGGRGRQALDQRKKSSSGQSNQKTNSPCTYHVGVSDSLLEDGRLHVVLFAGVDTDERDCLYAPLDVVSEGSSFTLRPVCPTPAEHGEGEKSDKLCQVLPVLAYQRSTCSFISARRFRRMLCAGDGDDPRRGGVLLLTTDFCLEWQWSNSDSSCRLILRETSWGVPCSSILRVDLPSSATGTAPMVLPGGSWNTPSFLATVLWQTQNAVFSTPLSVPSRRTSHAVGALAEVPFQDVDEANIHTKAMLSPQKDDLLLAAAGVADSRGRQLCRSLLQLCRQSSQDEAASLEPNAFLSTLRQQKNGRNELENGICRFLRSGILPASSRLVSFLIQCELERAAECCCTDPGLHERDIVRLLRWRPEVFLPVVLHRTPHLSKPLLVQAFQELLAKEQGQHSGPLLQMLKQLLSWLELYIHASSSKEDRQKAETAPSLELLLDFVAVLADAELPTCFSDRANGEGAHGPDHQERVIFSKILRRVHDLLQQEDGAVLRRLEGRLLAVLTSGHALSSDAAVGHSLVRRVTVSL